MTPQAPNRPGNVHTQSEAISASNNQAVHSHSNLEVKKLNIKSSGQTASRTGSNTLANSLIHGRKVDSPKIFVKDVTDRPKTSA